MKTTQRDVVLKPYFGRIEKSGSYEGAGVPENEGNVKKKRNIGRKWLKKASAKTVGCVLKGQCHRRGNRRALSD